MTGALVEKRTALPQGSARTGDVVRPGVGTLAGRQQTRSAGVLEPQPALRAMVPDLDKALPVQNGSRRRIVTKTTTERFAIEDDVHGVPAASVAVDREGLISRALRMFIAVLAGLLAVLLCSAGAGMMVHGQYVGAFMALALACGLGVVARECWVYEHG